MRCHVKGCLNERERHWARGEVALEVSQCKNLNMQDFLNFA